MEKRALGKGLFLLLSLFLIASCGKDNSLIPVSDSAVVSPTPVSTAPVPVDESYLKFDVLKVNGTSLRKVLIYFNNNKVPGSVTSPFYMGSFNQWLPELQTVTDSNGWGRADLSNIIQPKEIRLLYGGNYSANSWVDGIQNSYYYDPAGNDLQFCINNDIVARGACPGAYEAVKFISSVKNTNLTYTYTLGLRSDLIAGVMDAPFVMGEFNGWAVQPISDSDADGYYEVAITTFNKEIKLTYGGSMAGNSWADSSKSIYFDSTSNSLIIDFFNGEIQNKGTLTSSSAPGAYGDDFVRFMLNGTTLTIYLNNNKVSGSISHPFYFGSQNLWASTISQATPNASGWGNVTLDVSTVKDLYFNYGGDNSSPSQTGWTWAPITGSAYYNPALRYLCIRISGSSVMACQ